MCAGLVQKDENITRNRVFPQIIPHNPSQTIETIAHIGGLAAQKVAQIGTQPKHLTVNLYTHPTGESENKLCLCIRDLVF